MDLLYDRIMIQNDIEMALGGEFPLGVTVQQRYGDGENLLLCYELQRGTQTGHSSGRGSFTITPRKPKSAVFFPCGLTA